MLFPNSRGIKATANLQTSPKPIFIRESSPQARHLCARKTLVLSEDEARSFPVRSSSRVYLRPIHIEGVLFAQRDKLFIPYFKLTNMKNHSGKILLGNISSDLHSWRSFDN